MKLNELDDCFAITDLGYELVRIVDNERNIAICDVLATIKESEYKVDDTIMIDLLSCRIFSADEYEEAYIKFKQMNEEREYKNLKEYYNMR